MRAQMEGFADSASVYALEWLKLRGNDKAGEVLDAYTDFSPTAVTGIKLVEQWNDGGKRLHWLDFAFFRYKINDYLSTILKDKGLLR